MNLKIKLFEDVTVPNCVLGFSQQWKLTRGLNGTSRQGFAGTCAWVQGAKGAKRKALRLLLHGELWSGPQRPESLRQERVLSKQVGMGISFVLVHLKARLLDASHASLTC